MRYIVFLGGICLIFFLSCVSGWKDAKQETTHNTIQSGLLHKTINETNNGELTGKIAIYSGDKNIYFEQNWDSRSKISLIVTGGNAEEIRKFEGKIIVVNGTVVKTGKWSGTINIIEILSNY